MNHSSKPRRLKQRFSCSCRRRYQHALFKVLIRRAQSVALPFPCLSCETAAFTEQMQKFLDKIDTSNEVGLRDRGC